MVVYSAASGEWTVDSGKLTVKVFPLEMIEIRRQRRHIVVHCTLSTVHCNVSALRINNNLWFVSNCDR